MLINPSNGSLEFTEFSSPEASTVLWTLGCLKTFGTTMRQLQNQRSFLFRYQVSQTSYQLRLRWCWQSRNAWTAMSLMAPPLPPCHLRIFTAMPMFALL